MHYGTWREGNFTKVKDQRCMMGEVGGKRSKNPPIFLYWIFFFFLRHYWPEKSNITRALKSESGADDI